MALRDKLHQKHKTITIGVMGTSRGCGTTHLVCTLATYFNKHRHQTAIVERQTSQTFTKIEEAFEGQNNLGSDPVFVMKKMTFFKQYKKPLAQIRNEGYSVVIVDYGSEKSIINHEILDMDIKIVVGYGNEWKLHEFQPYMDSELNKALIFALNLGSHEEAKWFKSEYSIKAFIIPFNKEPFLWTKVLDHKVEQLLGL